VHMDGRQQRLLAGEFFRHNSAAPILTSTPSTSTHPLPSFCTTARAQAGRGARGFAQDLKGDGVRHLLLEAGSEREDFSA